MPDAVREVRDLVTEVCELIRQVRHLVDEVRMPDAEVPALDPGLRDLIAEVREREDPISEGGIRRSDMLRLTLGCADDGGPATGR